MVRTSARQQSWLVQVGIIVSFAVLPLASQAGPDAVPGEIIVKMKGRPSSTRSAALLGKIASKADLKSTFGKLNMHYLAIKDGADFDATLSELRQDADVEYAEPNFILRKVDDGPTEDLRKFSSEELVGMLADKNIAQGNYAQSGAPTKVTQAWAQMSAAASDVPVVAVIDTGVDYNHSVFKDTGAIWTNAVEAAGRAGIDDDGNGFIDDIHGWNFVNKTNDPMDDDDHGTHVAGIILGVTEDIQISNAGPRDPAKIRIMPLKFLAADGSGSTADAISAIYYAVNNGANIINNSWGGDGYSQALHDALTYAYDHHLAMAAAAGNMASNNDSKPMFPASYPVPSQIAVAATNDWDRLASFSNYGAVTVQVSAPGVGILSTVPGGLFRYMSGTSMASPFVAGLMAAVLREAPQLTGYQVRNIVMNSGEFISDLRSKTTTAYRVNGLNSVVNSKTQVSTTADQPVYVAAASNVSASAGSRAPAAAQSKVGGCGTVGSAYLYDQYASGGGGGNSGAQAVAVMSLLPLLVWAVMRARARAKDPSNRRVHERFMMNSEIKVRVGERELVANLNTISMGGVSFQAEEMLERGGVVTMQIAGPDGAEQIQVEGRIVWNEANRSYGVQFQDAKSGVLERIGQWTNKLAKAS